MDWYYYVALVLIALQIIFSVQVVNNYRYALNKYKRNRTWYRPRTVLIVPCKGLDSAFHKNISSLFFQDYEDYLLWFVVAEQSDPAYAELNKIKEELSQSSKAREVRIFVAGRGQACGQKIHNLLYCCERISDDIEVLAFADSDICINSNWLSHLVYPLRQSKVGASSGYRWFIPIKNNLASLALSALNAKVAQLLGNTRFNQAWGGSMAIRVDVFRKVSLGEIWSGSLSDDLSLSIALKKVRLKVTFVPACFVASHQSTTWRDLFEFGRRQFLITRVYAPGTWFFGLFSGAYSVFGLWGGAGLAIYAAMIKDSHALLYMFVPIVFLAGQLGRAVLRQKMAAKLLNNECRAMKPACIADILGFWFWSILMFVIIASSAFGRTICWRGIRYKLLGPAKTIVTN